MTPMKTTKNLSPVSMTLRAEGLATGIAAIAAYALLDGSWGVFALLILAPDLAMLGYWGGKKVGTVCYNCAHTLLVPLGLGAAACAADAVLALQLALIWMAHIGLDRAMGYGLKYATGFKDSHLSRV